MKVLPLFALVYAVALLLGVIRLGLIGWVVVGVLW
jgi:hypothetical protein